jgi:hypothetical protein
MKQTFLPKKAAGLPSSPNVAITGWRGRRVRLGGIMSEIAELMGAVTNCAVAGIQAGRDIGKAERDKLQSELDAAVRCLRDIANAAHDYDQQGPASDSRFHEIEYMACRFLATLEREDARTEARILAREDAA